LCCPVGPESATRRAIVLMRKTYLQATKVLVLEKYLAGHRAADISTLEKLLRLYCSTWATRLWTLQEGFLAKSLYIQFNERAVPFINLFDDLAKSNEFGSELTGGLLVFLSQYIINKKTETLENPYLLSLAHIQSYVVHRQTSCPEDEPLCLGTLLGLDIDQLFGGDVKDRMRRFWLMQAKIPSDMLFLRRGQRFKSHGLRWAPETFMVPGNDVMTGLREVSDQFDCVRTDDGLHVRYSGFFLPNGSLSLILPFFWICRAGATQKYLVKCDNWLFHRADGSNIIGDQTNQEVIDLPLTYGNHYESKLGLILRAPLETLENSPDNRLGGIHVTLVFVYAKRDDIYYAQLLTNGLAMLEDRGRVLFPIRRLPTSIKINIDHDQEIEFQGQQLDGDSQVFDVESTDGVQEWCVG
jgi:hypothetical protein